MTFLTNIPFSGESLGQSRPQVQTNFQVLQNTISVDHIAMNSAGAGKHNKSTYVEQGSDPTTAANEIAVYSKLFGSVPGLYQRQQSNGTVTPLVTFVKSDTVTIAGNAQTQYSITIGGVAFKWGIATNCPNNTTVPYATAFTSGTQSVQLTIVDPNATSILLNVSSTPIASSFSVKTSANISFYYLAIGD